jgi:uncharacterized DUF497 family protein
MPKARTLGLGLRCDTVVAIAYVETGETIRIISLRRGEQT